MSLEALTSFFMWCTIINLGLLTWAFVIFSLAGGWVYRIQRRFFPLTREQFNVTMYAFLGGYKLIVFVFNVVPWITLLIIA